MASDRFERAIAAIDAANADDPHVIEVRGAVRPKEQAHAELMSEWVLALDPAADEAQLLAARAHHLRRWTSPRASYPEGRAGYLRWRTALRKQHATEVADILVDVGYGPEVVERVQAIVEKRGLGTDPAAQVHEDALCLVFLETQLAGTAARLGDAKAVEVIRKTAAKMSPAGLARAAELPLPPEARDLLSRALTP
ncbi:MAG TPA: DUF4202 domain-containing protein [Acidimicrobiales bacterium]|jgi:hypothetical protein|nr:DUF4202 domain-containing protein [Acidimicrobiales bacterium]